MRKSSDIQQSFLQPMHWVKPVVLIVAGGVATHILHLFVQPKPEQAMQVQVDPNAVEQKPFAKQSETVMDRALSLPDTLLGATVEKKIVPGSTKVFVHIKTAHLSPKPDEYERAIMERVDDDLLAVTGAVLAHFRTNAVWQESTSAEILKRMESVKNIKQEMLPLEHSNHFTIQRRKQEVQTLLNEFGADSREYQDAAKDLERMKKAAMQSVEMAKKGDEMINVGFVGQLYFDNDIQLLVTSEQAGVDIRKLFADGVPMDEIEKQVYEDREEEAVLFATADKDRDVIIFTFGAYHDFSDDVPPDTTLVVITPATVRSFEEATPQGVRDHMKNRAKGSDSRGFPRSKMKEDDGREPSFIPDLRSKYGPEPAPKKELKELPQDPEIELKFGK